MSKPELELDNDGLLPQGVHSATLEQIEAAFGAFQRTDRRPILARALREYVAEVRRAKWDVALIVDGSFVMRRIDEPEDIDLMVILPAFWDFTAEIQPFEYNLLSRKRVRKRFGFDVFVVRADSVEEAAWIEYFQQVNVKWYLPLGLPPGTRKGIVRLAL